MGLLISGDDEAYLLKAIQEGNAMPVLGAGASVSSRNAEDLPVPLSDALAERLCKAAAIPYAGERLKDVLDAISGDKLLSSPQILDVYKKSYKGCKPSIEFEKLFKYTWRRLYLWNVDDLIENNRSLKSQSIQIYNGMIDRAIEFDSHEYLHIVYLHGQITKPEHRFIFTENEYNNALNGNWHHWYKRLAQDYFTTCPIIIGSAMNEPILSAEIDRVKREAESQVGRAFLVTPDELTQINLKALRARGIVHVKGTLESLVEWLEQKIPGGSTPIDVLSKKSSYKTAELDQITKAEIGVAHSLYPVNPTELRLRARQLGGADYTALARQFFNGFPPSWQLVATDIPVELAATKNLYEAFLSYLKSDHRLFVVTGQSGSGKSAAAMQSLLHFANENPKIPVFDMSPDVKSVQSAFKLIEKLHPDGAVVYISDIFVYGDNFSSDLEYIKGKNIWVVSTARTNEWRDKLSRYTSRYSDEFLFERFSEQDMEPLIERILKFVPSPRFRRLTLDQQKKRLRSSRKQLLIALREATDSENFTNVISHEFEKLPDADTKKLLLIVGLATIARVGISDEMAREVYGRVALERSYQRALDALAGIVDFDRDARLFARHELYIRHIIEKLISFADIIDAIVATLRYYLKYNIPVVRSVGRRDALLFRAILNHKFISENERRKNSRGGGIKIYEEFEVDFQLDGHFWLQYGLYLAGHGDVQESIKMLRRSIDAFPENPFAVHAYGDVQLRYAAERTEYDSITKDIIKNAVASLKKLDADSPIEVDVYPIVTLVNGHISALIKHKDKDEATKVAREYFDRLTQVEKLTKSITVKNARERVLRFVTLGDWQERYMDHPNKHRSNKRRQQRGKVRPG
ncbi:SIR2 family protein [Agrobacterium sp. El2ro-1b]|uniref:P-loop NTPase n=1 Tax=Agrobacterium sp. El2ro-1b TaxID=2969528 RepID=UPI003AAE08DE